jgi:Peptidase A4 family
MTKPRALFLATVCAAVAISAVTAATATAASGSRNLRTPGPAKRLPSGVEQIGSFNWSGWAQKAPAGTFRAANDTWTVPTVNTALAGSQYSSDWVGIGGLFDGTLVQDGTEADNVGGVAVYRAWTEILPEPENPLPLEVHPGDKVTATVLETKPGVWKMTVADKTTKITKSRTQAYAGSTHASVEAIHERPCIKAPCTEVADLAELAQTTNVTFDPGHYGTAVGVAPKTPQLSLTPNGIEYELFMLNNTETAIIASPSAEDKDHDGFAVADGAVSPPPPKS